MKKIGFIPLRQGSKGILNKNKRKILGRPIYAWVLEEAIKSNIDSLYVFTDDTEIINQVQNNYHWSDKVKVIKRGEINASDVASTESAIFEFCEQINYDFDIFTLLQATSPLTKHNDINDALNLIENKSYDSVLSVVESKRFFWNEQGESINYNFKNRPRRQDFKGTYVENGAIYCTRKKILLEEKNRLGGKIGLVQMPEETYVEIDEPHDFNIIENLLKPRLKFKKTPLKKIKVLVLDVDGVFTNGTVTYSNTGEFSKTFNMRDGMGLEVLRDENIIPIILTSENSKIVAERMKKLVIKHVHLGVKDKYAYLNMLVEKLNISHNEIAYLGDDINDLANILSVGWGICPNDAVNEVKQNADIILNNPGGKMAIRETVQFIIKYNSRF
jgi:YrbI family 3-deoxy-D-manno-octulosonate 8-phosphate phosphatase